MKKQGTCNSLFYTFFLKGGRTVKVPEAVVGSFYDINKDDIIKYELSKKN